MGFAIEGIIIDQEIENVSKFLTDLGYKNYISNNKKNFSEATSKSRIGVYIAYVNNCTLVITNDAFSKKRKNKLFEIESKLISLFPKNFIYTFYNYESSNSYMYHLIKNGQTIRLKQGYHPDIEFDIGRVLKEESEKYLLDSINTEMLKHINLTNNQEELLTHDQVGGELAFHLSKILLNKNLLKIETEFDHYINSKSTSVTKYIRNELHNKISVLLQDTNLEYHANRNRYSWVVENIENVIWSSDREVWTKNKCYKIPTYRVRSYPKILEWKKGFLKDYENVDISRRANECPAEPYDLGFQFIHEKYDFQKFSKEHYVEFVYKRIKYDFMEYLRVANDLKMLAKFIPVNGRKLSFRIECLLLGKYFDEAQEEMLFTLKNIKDNLYYNNHEKINFFITRLQTYEDKFLLRRDIRKLYENLSPNAT